MIILAAVHALTRRGVADPLADLYRQLARGEPLDRDPFPLFRAFCHRYREQLIPLIASERVQTNEVGRAVYISLALSWLGARHPDRLFSQVELGASAGLNLVWDRFAIHFFDPDTPEAIVRAGVRVGPPDSPVQLRCAVRGRPLPEMPGNAGAAFVERLGLDLDPPDITSPDTANWLAACVWADHPQRLERLTAAIALAASSPWRVRQADVTTSLGHHVGELRKDTLLCLVHTYVLHQLAAGPRARFHDQIRDIARRRPVFVVGLEMAEVSSEPLLTVSEWRAGELVSETVLAVGEHHGRWVKWLHPHALPPT